MVDVTVRRAEPTDVPSIRWIAERGWNVTYEELLDASTIDAALAEWYEPHVIRDFVTSEDVYYAVAESDGEVLGYASAGFSGEEGVAGLDAIYVDPDHWGAGIGSRLLDHVEAVCRERDSETMRVRVLSDNDIGTSFYRSRGYELVGREESELFGEPVEELVFGGTIE